MLDPRMQILTIAPPLKKEYSQQRLKEGVSQSKKFFLRGPEKTQKESPWKEKTEYRQNRETTNLIINLISDETQAV